MVETDDGTTNGRNPTETWREETHATERITTPNAIKNRRRKVNALQVQEEIKRTLMSGAKQANYLLSAGKCQRKRRGLMSSNYDILTSQGLTVEWHLSAGKQVKTSEKMTITKIILVYNIMLR